MKDKNIQFNIIYVVKDILVKQNVRMKEYVKLIMYMKEKLN